ncbi:hypothetical protein ACS0TY_013551 [Phlomoides rotata]
MDVVDDSSSEEDNSSGDDDDDDESLKPIKHISGDDLGDSFSNDAKLKTKAVWIDDILGKENATGGEEEEEEKGSDEDDGEYKKAQSLKDWEQSDDDNIETNVEDEEEDGELPYTIEAPNFFEEFNALLENRSNDQILEAIRRIRTFNAIAVAAENRKKMQVFYGILLQYFVVLANKKPLNFELLNMLVKPLMEMSTEIPYFAAICARKRCWPSLKTLFLLRLWSMIFPCSDFRHVVMTPAILLMCEYLMRCPLTSGRDITIGSFMCSMVLSVSRQSKKYCPEAITFTHTMLMAALSCKQKFETSQFYHMMELKALSPLLHIQGRVEEIDSLDFLTIMDLPDDSSYFSSDGFRASILFAIIGNLKGFVTIYEDFKSFPDMFLPIAKVLHGLAEEEHIPKFEENYVKGRDYDPDRERAERKKLRKILKQEAKGAVRELRKDNYFLLDVKERDKVRLKEEKAEKYGKIELSFKNRNMHSNYDIYQEWA